MAQRCSCELTLALLERLGGPHARRMRAAGQTQTAAWSSGDWLAHMSEEEALMFPMLPPRVRQRLFEEHLEIRKMLSQRRGKVPSRYAASHADLEDQWAEAIAGRNGWNLHEHSSRVRGRHPRQS